MRFGKTILATLAFATLASGAMAADYKAPAPVKSGFDWDGFYAGLGVKGSVLNNGVVTDNTGYVDVILGVNVTQGDILFGVEGWAGWYAISGGASGWQGGAAARLGYLATPDAVLYGAVGGQVFDLGGQYLTVGGGVEFALTDNFTLDAEYKYHAWSNNGFTGHSFGVSGLWHF